VESVEELLGRSGGLLTLNGLLAELLLGESSSVRVEAEHDLLVAERVLLLDVAALGASLALRSTEDGLDFGGVDQASQISVGNNVLGQEEVLLEGSRAGAVAEDLVEGLEGGGGPDNEATEVTTRGELEEVEGKDGGSLNTGDVAEGTDELLAINLGVVDNERTAALAEAAVPELTLTGTHLAGLGDLDELVTGSESLKKGDGGLGLGESSTLEGLGLNNERNLRDVGDAVTASEEKGRDGRSSKSGSSSETPIIMLIPRTIPIPSFVAGCHTSGSG
jgi:hypothetical protein